MRINANIIAKLNPCASRFENFKTQYPDFDGELEDFVLLENITYSDKVWVFTRLATKEQNVKWSLLCASKVLSIFEEKYPDDKRLRLALEAVETWINSPTEENRQAAAYAASAAASAASAAAYAASAASAAAYAASAAAYAASAASAASAAAYAAYAASAASAASAAARNIEEEVNLICMVEAVRGE